jgi:hypothetical protein
LSERDRTLASTTRSLLVQVTLTVADTTLQALRRTERPA